MQAIDDVVYAIKHLPVIGEEILGGSHWLSKPTPTWQILRSLPHSLLGCDDTVGVEDMRRGEFAGDQMSVDHVLPRAKYPHLDNVLANLELMPLHMNTAKSAEIAERQREMAKRLAWAGMLETPAEQTVVRPPSAVTPAPPAAPGENLFSYPTRAAAIAAGIRPCPHCQP